MSNRNYYKQGQSSKVPYILVIVILALLYIMNGMNEDRKDADRMFNQVLKEFKKPSCDSLKAEHKKEVDSLIGVIDWYRTPKKKTTYTKTQDESKKNTSEKPASTVTQDTIKK